MIEALFPTEGTLLRNGLVTAEMIVKGTESAGVFYATGGSDAESIRDFDSGNGASRFSIRDPYFYRREDNANGWRYRRKCVPYVLGHAQLQDGTPVNELMWRAEYSTDEEGDVPQPSFVLEATVPTDADGNVTVPKPADSAAAATEKAWKEMCGDDFTKPAEIRDFQGDTRMI